MCNRVKILLLSLLVGTRLGAATLKGVVKLNEAGGRVASGVQISAADGANAVVSNTNGTFTLIFPRKEPGETIQLLVTGRDLVVVNDRDMHVTLPKDPGAAFLTIVVCREADRDVWKQRRSTVPISAVVDNTYIRKRDELKTKPGVTEEDMAKLQEKYEGVKGMLAPIVEELTKQQPAGGSKLNDQVSNLLLDGKVEEARSLLDKKTHEAVGKSAAQLYKWSGDISVIQFQFEEAEKAYRTAMQIEPDNTRPLHDSVSCRITSPKRKRPTPERWSWRSGAERTRTSPGQT
jgi:hypothetical protein